ncbi:MAG: DUF2071 domain-containing protein [Deltaproteobacteria bacterium]|nr:DUF2071 domain-containing protein [Deltaproteobacteria bacterium]
MLYLFKRHRFPTKALLREALVLTFALPAALLEPWLAPSLKLETLHRDKKNYGLLYLTLFQMEALRLASLPSWLGKNLFLASYGLLVRYKTKNGKLLRGFRTLRSDTDQRVFSIFGNFFTHDYFQLADARINKNPHLIHIQLKTIYNQANLDLKIKFDHPTTALPKGSLFKNEKEAKLLGDLPNYYLNYERETHSMIVIPMERPQWRTQFVPTEIIRCSFFNQEGFNTSRPILLSSVYAHDIECLWKAGMCEAVNRGIF